MHPICLVQDRYTAFWNIGRWVRLRPIRTRRLSASPRTLTSFDQIDRRVESALAPDRYPTDSVTLWNPMPWSSSTPINARTLVNYGCEKKMRRSSEPALKNPQKITLESNNRSK